MTTRRRSVLTALVLAFVIFAGWQTAARLHPPHAAEAVPVIRFAHFQLEGGVREAFDRVARDFEAVRAAQGRPVRVKQIAIPERVYPSWSKVQLVGGTAPEIMMIPQDTVTLARYFRPLGEAVERPNPYNNGTPLEGQPWRATFLDGMTVGGFNPGLLDHYSIPYTVITVRMFYNRTLVEEILRDAGDAELRAAFAGSRPGPRNYAEFIRLCEAIEAYAARHGRTLFPLAGSSYASSVILERLMNVSTQRIALTVDPRGPLAPLDPPRAGLVALLRGDWSLEGPAFRAGLELAREVAGYMPPGFNQLKREDGVFYFVQQRAVMLAALAIEGEGLRTQADGLFDISAFPLPFPEPGDPGVGHFVLGRMTEADVNPHGLLGVVSLHAEERQEDAIDFLRYLTSLPGNQTFSDVSGWLPCIVGVEPRADLQVFMPVTDGYDGGVDVKRGDADLIRAIRLHFDRLTAADGSVEAYLAATLPVFTEAVVTYLERDAKQTRTQIQLSDVLIAAWRARAAEASAPDRLTSKVGRLIDGQHAQELDTYWRALVLPADTVPAPGPGSGP